MSWSGSKSIFAQIQSVVGWCKKGKRKRLLTMNNFNGWDSGSSIVEAIPEPKYYLFFGLLLLFFLFSFKFLPSWSGMNGLVEATVLTDDWLYYFLFPCHCHNDWQLGCRWGVCAYVAMFTDWVGELIWYRCGAQKKSDAFDCGDGVLLFGSSLWSFGVVFWSLMLWE